MMSAFRQIPDMSNTWIIQEGGHLIEFVISIKSVSSVKVYSGRIPRKLLNNND